MPYKVQGKVLGKDGFPIYSSDIMVKEIAIPGNPWSFPGGSAWVDENTGDFTIMANGPSSLLEVSGAFIYPKLVFANQFTGTITVEENAVIVEGKVKPKKQEDNSKWWILGVFGSIAAIALASGKKKPAKAVAKPVAKKPKEVTV